MGQPGLLWTVGAIVKCGRMRNADGASMHAQDSCRMHSCAALFPCSLQLQDAERYKREQEQLKKEQEEEKQRRQEVYARWAWLLLQAASLQPHFSTARVDQGINQMQCTSCTCQSCCPALHCQSPLQGAGTHAEGGGGTPGDGAHPARATGGCTVMSSLAGRAELLAIPG